MFPLKSSGYKVNNVVCEDGATASFDTELWGLVNINPNGAKKIKCNIDFKMTTLVEYLTNLESNELVEDDFGNLRYIGANPNNYVKFNDELWRIIGVMKDIENPDGTKEDKVKLIRSESIGSYAWDNKASGIGSSTSQYGSNDWSDSALQKVLNEGAYYNRTSGDCPYGKNGATAKCNFSSTGLTEESKNMISEVVWNLGSVPNGKTFKEFYELERGSTVGSGRPTSWTGKVGLMYPSDYGYATSGGSTTDRDTCLNRNSYKWSEVSDCQTNAWLYNGINDQWTLTPLSSSTDIAFVVIRGDMNHFYLTSKDMVRPSIYLKPSIGVESGGAGTSTSPFVLK